MKYIKYIVLVILTSVMVMSYNYEDEGRNNFYSSCLENDFELLQITHFLMGNKDNPDYTIDYDIEQHEKALLVLNHVEECSKGLDVKTRDRFTNYKKIVMKNYVKLLLLKEL
ncbi:MAG: hypothetical protein ACRCZR_01340, partial [Cetobacterium sp.]